MDQIKIGQFISACRKEQGITQAALAEKLGISDRAVSKWENGKSMPDSGMMLELCEILKINVNELLSGEKIMTEAYNKMAEENLLTMKRSIDEKNRQMLRTVYLGGIPCMIGGIVMCYVAYYIDMPTWTSILLIAVAILLMLAATFNALRVEHKAGYYECQCCKNRYTPTFAQVAMALQGGGRRYMKCPKCGKWSLQKKVLTKEEEK